MAKRNTVERAWHPDFRNTQTLPDIKPVRSMFFINFGTLALTIILVFYWGFLEWQLATLGRLTRKDQCEIERLEKLNKEWLKQSAEFERVAKLISEIQGFVALPLKPSEFFSAVGSIKPANMVFTNFSFDIEPRVEAAAKPKTEESEEPAKKQPKKTYAVYVIAIKGAINGSSASQATRVVEAFRDRLGSLELLKGCKFTLAPTLKSFERDKGLDVYNFTLNAEVRL